ncbi:MAG: PaaI family thioesterase [Oscillospiraceae bacterium]|jgi:acyl-CoA thioesterase|nr:PaaI family thioesterase [Oscillospiraceae bacterium]
MSRTEWAREFFQKDRFASKTTGITIVEAKGDYAKCELKPNENHMNAVGAVMGGAIFTLADFAFAVATNTPERHVTSVTSEISYFARAKGDTLIAEANCHKMGKSVCFYTVEVKDNLGIHVANVSVTGFLV